MWTMSKLDNVQVENVLCVCVCGGDMDNVRITTDTGVNQYQLATPADKDLRKKECEEEKTKNNLTATKSNRLPKCDLLVATRTSPASATNFQRNEHFIGRARTRCLL